MEFNQERALEVATDLHKRWIEKFPPVNVSMPQEDLIKKFIEMWNYCNDLIVENHVLTAKSEEQLFKIDLIKKNKVDILEQAASFELGKDILNALGENLKLADILDMIKLHRCDLINNMI